MKKNNPNFRNENCFCGTMINFVQNTKTRSSKRFFFDELPNVNG